jgi:hypothetical protein
MLASLCVLAQDGAPAGAMKKAESAPAAKPEPLDPHAEAWIKMLAGKIADAQPLVRDSAIAGLEAVGKAALPTLNAMASGQDKALAEAAKKVADRINRGPQMAGARGFGRGTGEGVEGLAKELKLDEQKTQKLKDLEKAGRDRMRETFEAVAAGDLTREEAREEMKQYRDEMKKEYRKFLGEDEAKKVDEFLDRMGGGRRPGGGEGGGVRRRQGGGGGQDK